VTKTPPSIYGHLWQVSPGRTSTRSRSATARGSRTTTTLAGASLADIYTYVHINIWTVGFAIRPVVPLLSVRLTTDKCSGNNRQDVFQMPANFQGFLSALAERKPQELF
jgi:hypothetical protein